MTSAFDGNLAAADDAVYAEFGEAVAYISPAGRQTDVSLALWHEAAPYSERGESGEAERTEDAVVIRIADLAHVERDGVVVRGSTSDRWNIERIRPRRGVEWVLTLSRLQSTDRHAGMYRRV